MSHTGGYHPGPGSVPYYYAGGDGGEDQNRHGQNRDSLPPYSSDVQSQNNRKHGDDEKDRFGKPPYQSGNIPMNPSGSYPGGGPSYNHGGYGPPRPPGQIYQNQQYGAPMVGQSNYYNPGHSMPNNPYQQQHPESGIYGSFKNFGMVGEQLYRSGQPNELNFPFLEKLGLRTVIFLSDEPINPRFGRFLDEMGIVLHHIENDVRNSPWGTISEEGILKALELILDTSNYPIIITCLLGRHRTGTVVGCLRKLQHWNLASIFEEYRRYAGPKARAANEQFIELFDTDLVRSYRSQSKIPVELLADESETCEERDDGVKSRTIIFRNKI